VASQEGSGLRPCEPETFALLADSLSPAIPAVVQLDKCAHGWFFDQDFQRFKGLHWLQPTSPIAR
jgi:hypothetical protein